MVAGKPTTASRATVRSNMGFASPDSSRRLTLPFLTRKIPMEGSPRRNKTAPLGCFTSVAFASNSDCTVSEKSDVLCMGCILAAEAQVVCDAHYNHV